MSEPKKRVLIVDDDRFCTDLFKAQLEKDGFQVAVAQTVDMALEILVKKGITFDIILLDVMMPPGQAFAHEDTDAGLVTGFLLAREILESWPDAPLVFFALMSEDVFIEVRRRTAPEDARLRVLIEQAGFICKSTIEPPELVSKITDFLSAKQAK